MLAKRTLRNDSRTSNLVPGHQGLRSAAVLSTSRKAIYLSRSRSDVGNAWLRTAHFVSSSGANGRQGKYKVPNLLAEVRNLFRAQEFRKETEKVCRLTSCSIPLTSAGKLWSTLSPAPTCPNCRSRGPDQCEAAAQFWWTISVLR